MSWREERPPDIELGHDHALWFLGWHPDRTLNPQYADVDDVERAGAVVEHLAGGVACTGFVAFEAYPAAVRGAQPAWQVESEDPLTLSPSLRCRTCGDHGFIQRDRWYPA